MTRADEESSSAALEDEVVARLRTQGLIVGPGGLTRRSVGATLLVAVLAIALAALFMPHQRKQAPQGRLYVLALYTGQGYRAPASENRSKAREYGDWAREHRKGLAAVIGGEELEPSVAIFGRSLAAENELVGFYMVKARSDADAVALAKTTPHLRYGGIVSVRPAAI